MNISRQAMETLRTACITPEAFEDIEVVVREWVMSAEERQESFVEEMLESVEDVCGDHNQKVTSELKEAAEEYYEAMVQDGEEGFFWNGVDYDESEADEDIY